MPLPKSTYFDTRSYEKAKRIKIIEYLNSVQNLNYTESSFTE